MGHVSLLAHSSWESVLRPLKPKIEQILDSLSDEEIAPNVDQIFAACELDLEKVKCVIIGQDPYPSRGNANGLAFSVNSSVAPLPASLRNIFTELVSDLDVPYPKSGDLSPWRDQGVLLLNRVLTTRVGESNAHVNVGWQQVTLAIAQAAANQGAIGLLWGKSAQELSYLFTQSIEGVHPSPLSSYRGFFGSKPFSRVNQVLQDRGATPIDWALV
jgi:uracil-DNA glycosylase